jgi:hypothetical protein
MTTEATAYHEAGHRVVARVLEFRGGEATIENMRREVID